MRQFESQLLAAVVLLLLQQQTTAETRYDGDEVLKVTMEDSLSAVIDAMHELGPKIEIWRQLTSTSAHIYVPRSLSTAFRRHLDNIGAVYRPVVADVQRLIDEERESNAVNKTGKGSTGYRKRSVSHHQSGYSGSISNIYPTYDQLTTWLTDMSQQYANICTLHRIGQTFENRHIYVMKIFADSTVGARRPAIWIDAGIHAREWISVSTAVYFINVLLMAFSSQSKDWTEIHDLDWYIAPLLNPDGYAHAHHKDGDRLWRKNRMRYNESISFSQLYNESCIGVDLNRNFNFQWGTVSANDEPCYSVYGGPWPSSELETQAIMSFLLEHKNSVAALLTVHNYGQMILSRWAYTDALYPPEHNETVELMSKMADAIYQTGGLNYSFGTAPELLYKFSGGFGDWSRGVAGVKYSFEIELRDRGQLAFILPTSYILPVGEEMWSAVRVLAAHVLTEKRAATTTSDISDWTYAYSNGTRTAKNQLTDSPAVFLTCTMIILSFAIISSFKGAN